MNVLIFSNCSLDPLLGSGRTRLAWSAGLRARGHAVEVIDPDLLLGPSDNQPRGRRRRIMLRALRWLRQHDLSGYDLIECFGAEFWGAIAWLTKARPRARRPFVVSHTDGLELLAAERTRALAARKGVPAHPGWRGWLRRMLIEPREQQAFTLPDGFVTGCELDRRYLLDHRIGPPPERMAVIPLGLEPIYLDRPLSHDGRENRIAFLGSWIERKGIETLVAVLVPLLRAQPTLNVDLLGIGAPEELARAAFPCELWPRLEITQRLEIPAIVTRLARARVFFLPTEYEGFGLALAEAMACGCAAVTTPTGFGADLHHGVEALVCPFGDVGAMRHAVEQLLTDATRRLQIAENGWRRVQTLRWETSVERLEHTYLGWLKLPTPPANQ